MTREYTQGPAPGPTTSAPITLPSTSPAERAAIVERQLADVRHGAETLATMRDRRSWLEHRRQLRGTTADLEKQLARVEPGEAARLRTELVELEARIAHAAEPPAYQALSHEAELLELIHARPVGGAARGNAQKEAAIAAMFRQFSIDDSRILASRLRAPADGDALAAGFAAIASDRRQRLMGILGDAARRDALANEAVVRAARAEPVAVPEALRLHEDVPAPKPVAPPPHVTDATAGYLVFNGHRLWSAVREYLAATAWPEPTPRVTWLGERAFATSLVTELHAELGDFDGHQTEVHAQIAALRSGLMTMLYPHDPFAEIEGVRPPQNSSAWSNAVAMRLAQLFHAAVAGSLTRLGPRYVAAADGHARAAEHGGVPVKRAELITSAPIDRFVAGALTRDGVAEVVPDARVKHAERTELRPVELTWEGDADPKLWNWVRANRWNATREEVAAKLFSYARGKFADDPTSFFAYGLAGAAPLFALPAAWAVQFPEMLRNAPEAIKQGHLPDPRADSVEARVAQLGGTSAGDELAIRQAAPIGKSTEQADEVMGQILLQFGQLRSQLVPWELSDGVIAETGEVVAKRSALRTATEAERTAWLAVAVAQRERLLRISTAAVELDRVATSMGANKRDAQNPLRSILSTYARAAAVSQIGGVADELIGQAFSQQASLSLQALQTNVVDLLAAQDQAQRATGSDPRRIELDEATKTTRDEARRLETRLLAAMPIR